MFSLFLKTVGCLGILAAIVFFVIQDRGGDMAMKDVHQTRMILLWSAGILASGYVVNILGRIVGVGKGRCKKCGKRILKTEMFCFDHSVDLVMKSKERERFGDMQKQHLK